LSVIVIDELIAHYSKLTTTESCERYSGILYSDTYVAFL